MKKAVKNKKISNLISNTIIAAFCVFMLLLEFINFNILKDDFSNRLLVKSLQQIFGFFAVFLLLKQLKIRLFNAPQNLLFVLPCMIIALDNFPLCSYLNGNMQFVRKEPVEIILFIIYCLFIGLFEEGVFRGLVFAVLLSSFSKDKKGLLKTYIFSSVIFGFAHIFNLFSGGGIGATLLQVGYTILTGGLFAFVLLKTKNIICCGFVHGLYNFCGLLLSENGLGTGIIFDKPTVTMMTSISVIIGLLILYFVWKYTEEEQIELYKRFDIKI